MPMVHWNAVGGAMSKPYPSRTEIRDGMRIEWDVPISMNDEIVLRADVFRPTAEGHYPVLLTYGPYAKGLAFQEGYAKIWEILARDHPDVIAVSTNKYQNWEVCDPEKWVPEGYVCVRIDSRGAARLLASRPRRAGPTAFSERTSVKASVNSR